MSEWGPPWLPDESGNPTAESSYYLSANRNKASVALDISRPEGQSILRGLVRESDVLVENFKVGGLAKYGLDYASLKAENPAHPIRLRLSLSYGLCEEICIPAQQDLALDIAPGERSEGAEMIQRALSDGPLRAGAAGLTETACELRPDERSFEARLAFAETPASSPVVVAESAGAMFGPLESRLDDGSVVATGEMTPSGGWIDRSEVQITVIGGDGSYVVGDCSTG